MTLDHREPELMTLDHYFHLIMERDSTQVHNFSGIRSQGEQLAQNLRQEHSEKDKM